MRTATKKYRKFIIIILSGWLLFYLGGRFFDAWAATPSDEVIVLNYHQVNDSDKNPLTVSPKMFAAELDYLLANGYNIITPDEFLCYLRDKASLPPRPVLITFDDGYADNYHDAYPILKERGLSAVIFLITDYIGTQKNYLTWPEVHEMAGNGIEFGSHTLSHSLLSAADPADAEYQLATSQAVFRWQFGKNARFLAYPCGYYDDTVKKIVEKNDFFAAFTVECGTVRLGDDRLALQRLPIFGDMENELDHFRLRLENVPLLKKLYALRTVLEKWGLNTLANNIPIP